MICPDCGSGSTQVVDSRSKDQGRAVRRRRKCCACQHRFTTYEVPQGQYGANKNLTEKEFAALTILAALEGRDSESHKLLRDEMEMRDII